MLPTHFTALMAQERSEELRDQAHAVRAGRPARRLFGRRAAVAAPGGEITIRRAAPGDAATLHDLAGLDSRPLPPGPLLVGELDGRPAAALSIRDRSYVADPFQPTAGVVGLLAVRAAQLDAAGARAERAGGLRLVSAVER